MKTLLVRSFAVLAAASLVSPIAYAQSGADANTEPDRDREGQVIVLSPPENGTQDGVCNPLMTRLQTSEQIQEKLREFQAKCDEYLARQEQLCQQLKVTTEAEREQLREQIRASRLDWTEQAAQLRVQARERIQEMREQLANHREMLDASREQIREAADAARERRGME